MSQQGQLDSGGSTPTIVETLTGNTGGAVGPDGANNINVVGDGTTANVAGNPGTNTLTISASGIVAIEFTEDSGTAVPAGGNVNVFGDATQGSVTSGAGDTITITNSDATEVQKGVIETATNAEAIAGALSDKAIVPSNLPPVFASPFPIGSVAPNTGAFTLLNVDNVQIDGNTISTTDTNGNLILDPDGSGTVNIAYATENAVAVYGASGALGETSLGTDGQVIIGATGGAPDFATLTSTDGSITYTTGANSLDLSANVVSTEWRVITDATDDLEAAVGFIANRAAGVTFTLPATCTVGDIIRVTTIDAGGWTIAQNASQTIKLGANDTTTGAGGSLASTANGDTVEMVCTVTNTNFLVLSSMGNITVV